MLIPVRFYTMFEHVTSFAFNLLSVNSLCYISTSSRFRVQFSCGQRGQFLLHHGCSSEPLGPHPFAFSIMRLGIALFWELIIVFICIICILIFFLTVVPGHNLGVRRHFFIVYKLIPKFQKNQYLDRYILLLV
jgi:ABC-type uncharacterized transport system fused permease/ATPase subunit